MINLAENGMLQLPEYKYAAEALPNKLTYESLYTTLGINMTQIFPHGSIGRYISEEYLKIFVNNSNLSTQEQNQHWETVVTNAYSGNIH
jgi:hypothetical protein